MSIKYIVLVSILCKLIEQYPVSTIHYKSKNKRKIKNKMLFMYACNLYVISKYAAHIYWFTVPIYLSNKNIYKIDVNVKLFKIKIFFFCSVNVIFLLIASNINIAVYIKHRVAEIQTRFQQIHQRKRKKHKTRNFAGYFELAKIMNCGFALFCLQYKSNSKFFNGMPKYKCISKTTHKIYEAR